MAITPIDLAKLEDANVTPEQVEALVEQIRPMLAGKPPPVQGAVLADLLGTWIAGYTCGDEEEDKRFHEVLIQMHIKMVRLLIPVARATLLHRLK